MTSPNGLRPIPVFILLLAMSILGVSVPARAASLFENPAYPVGSNPYGMGMADFNGDGLDDLVTGSYANGGPGPGSVTLLMGQGDGTFGDKATVPTQLHPSGVLAGDFDGDGFGDLVIGYGNLGLATTALGHGDGTFGPETPFSSIVYRLQLADFDDDAHPDLLGDLNISTGGFQAYLGNPDGTFTAQPGNVPPGADATFNPVALDLNGDGHDDVLTIRYVSGQDPHDILVFLGNGDGSFTPAGSLFVPDYVLGLIGADLDGDGWEDLVVSTAVYHAGNNGDVRFYFSNGDGTFTDGPVQTETFATAIYAFDRNGDGLQDFVRIGYDEITPYLATAPRSYAALPTFLAGFDMRGSVVGDFEGDGRSDLAVLGNFSEAVFVYAGNAAAGFGPIQDPPALDTYAGGVVTRDFDGDGHLDMAAAVLPEDEIAVRLGHGDGTFGPVTRYPAGVGPLFLEAADMNGDGRQDLVVSLRNWHFEWPEVVPAGDVAILLGNGDGTFQPPGPSRPSGLSPNAMHVADLDGDGVADVVVANSGDGILQPDLSFFHGQGDGTLAPEARLDAGAENAYPYGWTYPMGLASGDFDGDGLNDLVVAMTGLYYAVPSVPGAVHVLRGLPGGAFAPFATVGVTESSASVAVADLDADGDADIVVADVASYVAQRPGGLFMLLNDGSGAFLQSPILPSGIGPYFVQVADMTGDGLLDLVASANVGYTAILAGLGGGAYAEPIFFGTPGVVSPGDFDGDGFNDMLVVSYWSSFVMLNQTPSPVPLQIDASISFTKQAGRGSGLLTFTTNAENDLVGFNVVEITAHGTISINRALIPCEECTTGSGANYAFLVPRHRGGRDFYVEAVHAGGATDLFGPARRE